MSRDDRIVVAGVGLAGLRAAERLRELGFSGELVLVGDEGHLPYHRPALSKQLLTGALKPGELGIDTHCELDATWRLSTPVRHLDPRRRVLHLPGGEELGYDGLVIATGVEPRKIATVPHHDPRVVVLRTLADALALQHCLAVNRGPVVVLGGGFTGCELASSLRSLGREVTIVARSAPLMGNVLGPALAQRLTEAHRRNGVDLALGEEIRHWYPTPAGMMVQLSSGKVILASCVVVAAGTVPSVSWLRGSGIAIDDGVTCQPTCHVVGAEDVVAAGDVAQWPNLRFDNTPRRVEHWLNAVEMGRAAAESLLAGAREAKPFTPIPRFWSEQHGIRIQAAGIPRLGTDTIELNAPRGGNRLVTGYVRDGRLLGVVGFNSPEAVLSWTTELGKQRETPTTTRRHRRSVTPVPRQLSRPVTNTREVISVPVGNSSRKA